MVCVCKHDVDDFLSPTSRGLRLVLAAIESALRSNTSMFADVKVFESSSLNIDRNEHELLSAAYVGGGGGMRRLKPPQCLLGKLVWSMKSLSERPLVVSSDSVGRVLYYTVEKTLFHVWTTFRKICWMPDGLNC